MEKQLKPRVEKSSLFWLLIVLVVLLVLAVAVGTIAFALEISKLKSETALIKQQNSSAEQQFLIASLTSRNTAR